MKRETQLRVATEADRDAQLEQMRSEMVRAVYGLLEEVRARPDASSIASAVFEFVDAWSAAALEMIAAAIASATVGAADHIHASASVPPRSRETAPASSAEQLRSAILIALSSIVEATRSGRPDIDDACRSFADTYTACLGDAVAATGLRALAAFEQRLGVAPGLPN